MTIHGVPSVLLRRLAWVLAPLVLAALAAVPAAASHTPAHGVHTTGVTSTVPAGARRCDLILRWRVSLTDIPNWSQTRWNGPNTCRDEYQRGVSKCRGSRITVNRRGGWIEWRNHTTESRATCPPGATVIVRAGNDIRICDSSGCTKYVRRWEWPQSAATRR